MKTRTLYITETATFIALIAAGSWISIPFVPVPLTLQTLFVLLCGAVMKRNAAVPAGLYLLLGALGLPVFHNGMAGIGVLLGPTGGYLIGFVPAALVAGIAYERRSPKIRIMGLAAATAIIYICGVTWLSYSTGMHLTAAVASGMLPFIAGDAVKALAAYTVAGRLK